MSTGLHVLVIESCEINRNLLREILGDQSYHVTAVNDCIAALQIIKKTSIDLILIAQTIVQTNHYPEQNLFLNQVQSIPVLLLCDSSPDASDLRLVHPTIYVHKPYGKATLLDSIHLALNSRQGTQLSGAKIVSNTSANVVAKPVNDKGLIKTR